MTIPKFAAQEGKKLRDSEAGAEDGRGVGEGERPVA